MVIFNWHHWGILIGTAHWHPWRAVLGILCLAKLAGVPGSQREIADFAQRLTQPQRRQLGCRRDRAHSQRWGVPGQTTFFRALKAVDYPALEATLLGWQNDLLGPEDPKELVVLDGKTVRAAHQTVVTAISVPSGRVHGLEAVRTGTEELQPEDCPPPTARGAENEIPAARRLLARLPLADRLVALDALHTQHQTAAQLVLETGADYLLTLKNNQATLLETAQTLLPGDFFPSGQDGHPHERAHRGAQPRPAGNPPVGGAPDCARATGLDRRDANRSLGQAAHGQG